MSDLYTKKNPKIWFVGLIKMLAKKHVYWLFYVFWNGISKKLKAKLISTWAPVDALVSMRAEGIWNYQNNLFLPSLYTYSKVGDRTI